MEPTCDKCGYGYSRCVCNKTKNCPYCDTELVKRDTTALGGDESFDWCPDCERAIEDGERMEAGDGS